MGVEHRARRRLRFYARREVNSCAAGTWHFRSLKFIAGRMSRVHLGAGDRRFHAGQCLPAPATVQLSRSNKTSANRCLLRASRNAQTVRASRNLSREVWPQKPHERKTIPDLVFQPLQFDHSGGSPNPLKAGIPSLQIKETHLHGDPSLKVNCKTNTLRLNTPAALPP